MSKILREISHTGRLTTQVQLANIGSNPVTGFVGLAATGLPTGMTGGFTPAQIAGGQSATLTLTSGTAPAGPVTLTVTATTVVEGQTIVRQSPLTVTVVAAGGTTLAGRILATKDDAPIPGARVKIGSLIVTTDSSGNFLFPNAPTCCPAQVSAGGFGKTQLTSSRRIHFQRFIIPRLLPLCNKVSSVSPQSQWFDQSRSSSSWAAHCCSASMNFRIRP